MNDAPCIARIRDRPDGWLWVSEVAGAMPAGLPAAEPDPVRRAIERNRGPGLPDGREDQQVRGKLLAVLRVRRGPVPGERLDALVAGRLVQRISLTNSACQHDK